MNIQTPTKITTYEQLVSILPSTQHNPHQSGMSRLLPFAMLSLVILTSGQYIRGIEPWMLTICAITPYLIAIALLKREEKKTREHQRQLEEDYIVPFLNTATPQKMYFMTPEMESTIKEAFGLSDDHEELFAYWYIEESDENEDEEDFKREKLMYLFKHEARIHTDPKAGKSLTGEEYFTAVFIEDDLTDNYPQGLYNVTKYK